MKRHAYGFTLMELVLVMAIIGILAAVSLPMYQTYTNRAKLAEGLELVRPVMQSVSHYRDRWGRFPKDNATAGLPEPAALRGEHVESIEVLDGTIQVLFKLSGKAITLQFTPATPDKNPCGALIWICQDHKLPEGFTAHGKLPEASAQEAGILVHACKP